MLFGQGCLERRLATALGAHTSLARANLLARVVKVGAEVGADEYLGLVGRLDVGGVEAENAEAGVGGVVPRAAGAAGRHGVARHVHHG